MKLDILTCVFSTYCINVICAFKHVVTDNWSFFFTSLLMPSTRKATYHYSCSFYGNLANTSGSPPKGPVMPQLAPYLAGLVDFRHTVNNWFITAIVPSVSVSKTLKPVENKCHFTYNFGVEWTFMYTYIYIYVYFQYCNWINSKSTSDFVTASHWRQTKRKYGQYSLG